MLLLCRWCGGGGPGADVPQAVRGDGTSEVFADVAGAVVAHDPLHLDAALGEALERVLEKSHGVAARLRGPQLRDRVARVIVDCQVQVAPASLTVASADALAESSLADLPETTELLDVEVHELTGSGVLIPIRRRPWGRLPTRDAMPAQHAPDRRRRPAQHPGQALWAPAGRAPQLDDLLLGLTAKTGRVRSRDRRAVTQRLPASHAIARQSTVSRSTTRATHNRSLRRRDAVQHQPHQPAARLPRMTHPTRRSTLNHPGLRRVVDSSASPRLPRGPDINRLEGS